MSDNGQPQEQASIVIEFHSLGSLKFNLKVRACEPVQVLAIAGYLASKKWGDHKPGEMLVFKFEEHTVKMTGWASTWQAHAAAGFLRTLGERQLNEIWTADAVRQQRGAQAVNQVENMMQQNPGFILPKDGTH